MRSAAIYILVFGLTVSGFGSVGAVEMAPTPIQDQMAGAVASMSNLASDDFSDLDPLSPAEKSARPSVLKAAALSALLPGLGEYYIGHRTKAKYFFGAEALTWVGFFAFRTYGGWKKDDYIDLAAQYADAQLEDKDDEFLDWVGFYIDIDQYNTLGRVGDPDRPYLPDTPENHWLWESEIYQEAYRDLKNSSREAYRRSDFMIGVAVLNRVISVIDAVRDARRARRTIDDEFSRSDKLNYRVSVDPLHPHRQLTITLYTSF